jgi:hypothetical protein
VPLSTCEAVSGGELQAGKSAAIDPKLSAFRGGSQMPTCRVVESENQFDGEKTEAPGTAAFMPACERIGAGLGTPVRPLLSEIESSSIDACQLTQPGAGGRPNDMRVVPGPSPYLDCNFDQRPLWFI